MKLMGTNVRNSLLWSKKSLVYWGDRKIEGWTHTSWSFEPAYTSHKVRLGPQSKPTATSLIIKKMRNNLYKPNYKAGYNKRRKHHHIWGIICNQQSKKPIFGMLEFSESIYSWNSRQLRDCMRALGWFVAILASLSSHVIENIVLGLVEECWSSSSSLKIWVW